MEGSIKHGEGGDECKMAWLWGGTTWAFSSCHLMALVRSLPMLPISASPKLNVSSVESTFISLENKSSHHLTEFNNISKNSDKLLHFLNLNSIRELSLSIEWSTRRSELSCFARTSKSSPAFFVNTGWQNGENK